jgi:flavin-dependent dehydrogenase
MPTAEIWQSGTLYLEATRNGWWYSILYASAGQLVGYYTGIDLIKRSKLSLAGIFFRELYGTRVVGSLGCYPSNRESIAGQLAGVKTYDRIQGDSWISVGDAAFASDPLSGMGIEFAVESAILSASAIRNGLKPSTMNTYELWVNDYLKQHLELLNSYRSVVKAI